MSDSEDLETRSIERIRAGNDAAIADLFERHRPRLNRMVMLRMDSRVRARLDASDVLQDAFVEMSRRLPEYDHDSEFPFFLWLRSIVGQRLAQLHRSHLGAAKRSAAREAVRVPWPIPDVSVFALASRFAGQFTSVDRNLRRIEVRQKLIDALNALTPNDREIIAMRHFEELSTEEIAVEIGCTRSGVLKRYTRALRRLRRVVIDDDALRAEVADERPRPR